MDIDFEAMAQSGSYVVSIKYFSICFKARGID
jgi:hypothetical protein